MLNPTLLTPNDYARIPWRNNQGFTTEIAKRLNPRSGDVGEPEFIWRVSIADVDASGPFSDFSGYQRTIMLAQGNGMHLDFGDHGRATIAHPYDTAVFQGDWPTTCTLIDGPIKDFNLIAATGHAETQCRILRNENYSLPPGRPRGSTRLLHVFEGGITVVAGDSTVGLSAGDTLILESEENLGATIEGITEGFVAIVIDIHLREAVFP